MAHTRSVGGGGSQGHRTGGHGGWPFVAIEVAVAATCMAEKGSTVAGKSGSPWQRGGRPRLCVKRGLLRSHFGAVRTLTEAEPPVAPAEVEVGVLCVGIETCDEHTQVEHREREREREERGRKGRHVAMASGASPQRIPGAWRPTLPAIAAGVPATLSRQRACTALCLLLGPCVIEGRRRLQG